MTHRLFEQQDDLEDMYEGLTLLELQKLCKVYGIDYPKNATAEELKDLLEEDESFEDTPLKQSPFKPGVWVLAYGLTKGLSKKDLPDNIKRSDVVLLKDDAIKSLIKISLETPSESTTLAINRRISALSQDFTYKIVNGAIRITAGADEVMWLHWLVHPEDSKTGPCDECFDNAYGEPNFGYYNPDQFIPEMPVHNHCVCEWEIIYDFRDIIEPGEEQVGETIK